MTDYQALVQTEDVPIPHIYHTYKRRWFYLFVVCLAQISNALVN